MSTFHLIPLMTLVTRDTLDRLSENNCNFLDGIFVNRNAAAVPLCCQTKEEYSSSTRR